MEMSNEKVIFTLDGVNVTIECSKEDKIGDICQKFAEKIDNNINSLSFSHKGNQLDFKLSFMELLNNTDSNSNELNIIVSIKEKNKTIKQKFKEEIENIILSNERIKDIINENNIQIEQMVKLSQYNSLNIPLNNIKETYLIIKEKIEKINTNMKNCLNYKKLKEEENDIKLSHMNNKVDINNENLLKKIKAKLNLNKIMLYLYVK